MTIRINAPTEIYTPPPIALSSLFIERNSFRKLLFSVLFRSEKSIALISLNLNNTGFVPVDDATVLVAVIETDLTRVPASSRVGTNDSKRKAAMMQGINFFILLISICENISTKQKSVRLGSYPLHNSGKELHHSHISGFTFSPCTSSIPSPFSGS